MKKYTYKYCVYYNNMCAGVLFKRAYNRLTDAMNDKARTESSGGGCCDVVKKRFLPGMDRPMCAGIYNNYKYSEYDLYY
jgi:hypothetical protein